MKAYSFEAALKYSPEEITHLYIHNRGIETLPNKVFEFTNLIELDLGMNRLKALPNEFSKLSKIEALNLRGNDFGEFPPVISKLSNLKTLDIGENKISKLPDSIGQLKKIKTLELDENELKSLPKTLGKLEHLQHLNLEKNRLKILPQSLGNCRQLEVINLAHNRFSHFPEAVFTLTSPLKLTLSNNKIKQIPKEIIECKNLELLILSNNKLTEIPNFLSKLSGLKSLQLDGNELETLPSELVELTELTLLSISNNKFKEIPDCVRFMEKLKGLYFSKNQVSEIPSFISNFTHLQFLKFEFNKVTSFPSSFKDLYNLRLLKIRKNDFSSFPKEILYLDKLVSLDNFNGFDGKKIGQFIKNCQTAFIPKEQRWAIFQVQFLKIEDDFRKLDVLSLSKVLSFKIKKIRDLAREIILEKYRNQFQNKPLGKASIIHIAGKTLSRKSALVKRIESIGQSYDKAICPQTSHIVLGDLAKFDFENLPKNVVFISEKELNNWLQKSEKPWLLESGKVKEIQNLSKLLLTYQKENIALAIQMLEAGGVPAILLTDILIAFKKTDDKSVKRKLRKLLEIYVKKEELRILQARPSLRHNSIEKQKELISELAKNTVFDGKKLIEALFDSPS